MVDESQKHPLEKLMDNIWLLLFLGIVIPTISYSVWGWVEMAMLEQATLP